MIRRLFPDLGGVLGTAPLDRLLQLILQLGSTVFFSFPRRCMVVIKQWEILAEAAKFDV